PAAAHFQRAIEIDSNFALAWHELSEMYTWLAVPGSTAKAVTAVTRAAALNHGLGLRDSMILTADSLADAVGGGAISRYVHDSALWSHLRFLPPGEAADGVHLALRLASAGSQPTPVLEAMWDSAAPGARANLFRWPFYTDSGAVAIRLMPRIREAQRSAPGYDESANN